MITDLHAKESPHGEGGSDGSDGGTDEDHEEAGPECVRRRGRGRGQSRGQARVADDLEDRVAGDVDQERGDECPARPCTVPSSMNGNRMNQFVAPTSFITSISRRRLSTASWMALKISSTAPKSSTTATPK